MKSIWIISILAILIFSGCQSVEIKEDVPECIEQLIVDFEKNTSLCESGKSVYRYIFMDQFVYVFNPGDCGADMMSDVYDTECNLICNLGGIAGNLMCEDTNFWENSTGETLIWSN